MPVRLGGELGYDVSPVRGHADDATARVAEGVDADAQSPVHEVLGLGRGRLLEPEVRAEMEARLGHDFGNVRVHTDAQAAKSAQAIGALAYTVGHRIAFDTGRFAPQTSEGRYLLAHELVHTVQQRPLAPGDDVRQVVPQGDASEVAADRVAARIAEGYGGRGNTFTALPVEVAAGTSRTPVVHRALTDDFRIRDISPEDAVNPAMIFFDLGQTAIPGSEMPKIAALATPPGRALTLNGFASEEGSVGVNNATINARLNSVEAALIAAGHQGARARVNLRISGVGQIDYRHVRSVEVIPTPVGVLAAPSGVSQCGVPGSEVEPCGTAFDTAWPLANVAVNIAKVRLALPYDAGATSLLTTLFSGVPQATVVANIDALASQVGGLPAQHQCHNTCDAGCGRPAFNSGSGLGPGGAVMTLCPEFLHNADANWRAQILIHESAHGTPGLATDDIAYSSSRQIAFLSPADAVRNTDSYVLLAWLLAFPGTMTIGPATPDVIVASEPEQEAARRAIAWLESWLNFCDFDTEQLYGTVSRSVPPAPAWDTSQAGDLFNIETMHRIALIFGLTDPGAAAPFTPQPALEEKSKIAAIHDRYDQMYKAVDWQVLTVAKGAPGSDAWGSQGPNLPRLDQAVTVGPAFFGLGLVERIKHLLLLMATAMSGISAPFRPKYVDAADQIRQHRTLGP